MRRFPITILAFLTAACGDSSTGPSFATRPQDAKIITADIANFWTGFDQITSGSDTMPLRREYLNKGTDGLRELARLGLTSSTLTDAAWRSRDYYASIRANTMALGPLEPAIRQVYDSLDVLVSGSVFPDIYLTVGSMSGGGTASAKGLLIATEFYSLAPDSPLGSLSIWQQSVVRPTDYLAAVIAHEIVHYQQHYGSSRVTLLGLSIREGSADFIGELLSGRIINPNIREYGLAHEADLWTEFQKTMYGPDISTWLFNGGRTTASSTRPADLGYFIGYRITEAFYDKALNKNKALRDILTIQDFAEFLTESGYNPKS